MRILILGYGKMGKAIEQIALNRNHSVPFKIDVNNRHDLASIDNTKVDVAIEFSNPESAYENVRFCIDKKIPVVCGTTGWLQRKKEIEQLCEQTGGAFFYASNYSVGVNLFFHLNKILAKIMNNYTQYDVSMEEIHHTEKKDAPSGTAITLAEGIIQEYPRKKKWINDQVAKPEELSIVSERLEKVPGTHTIFYNSEVDTIEIRHTAHSRHGFAEGAVIAAEWLKGKKGVFGMDDMLKISY